MFVTKTKKVGSTISKNNKRVFRLLLSLMLLMTCLGTGLFTIPVSAVTTGNWLDGITGEPTNHWDNGGSINSEAEFAQFAYNVNYENSVGEYAGKNYEGVTITLEADLDLSAHFWTPIAPTNDPNRAFKGNFDGKNHTISGVKVNNSFMCAGVFGMVQNSTIENLKVIEPNIMPSSPLEAPSADPDHSEDSMELPSSYAGGIVGWLYSDSSVINCHVSSGTIKATQAGGGIAGVSNGEIINSSTINTNIYGAETPSNASVNIGGIVGLAEGNFDITNNYVYNVVIEFQEGYAPGGGINLGGLVGKANSSSANISNCFVFLNSVIDVSGSASFGGLAGNNNSNVTNSYWRTNNSAITEVGSGNGTLLNCSSFDTDYNFPASVTVGSVSQTTLFGALNEWVAQNNSEQLYKTWAQPTGSYPELAPYPPTVKININNEKFDTVISDDLLTFNRFYNSEKNVNLEVTDNDDKGIASTKYYISETHLGNSVAEIETAIGDKWTDYTGEFALDLNKKSIVYAKASDNNGSVTLVNSQGIVLYTNSEEGPITYSSEVTIQTNGNTIKDISVDDEIIDPSNYTATSSDQNQTTVVKFNEDYFNSLEVKTHNLTVSYNPLGETFTQGTSVGDPPLTTAITLNIEKRDSTIILNNTLTKEYDGTKVADPQLTVTGSSATPVVEWYEESELLNEAPTNAGSYKVLIIVAEDTGYNSAAMYQDFKITPKAITPNVSDITDLYYMGVQVKPIVEVKDGTTVLTEGIDYDITYGANNDVATKGTVTVTLKGNYTGTKTVTFNILEEVITEGENQTVAMGEEITFKSNGDFGTYTGTQVDGKEVDSKYLTVDEGSIIVTLSGEYTKTLSAGTHTISINSENGSAKTNFTVVATTQPTTQPTTAPTTQPTTAPTTSPDSPDTGDDFNLVLWVLVAIVSLSVSLVFVRKKVVK